MNKLAGVYAITCHKTKKAYVGSSNNIPGRWVNHIWLLKRGEHPSASLQQAWVKYGPTAFSLRVLELASSPKSRLQKEQRWIDKLRSADKKSGYNINPIARLPPSQAKVTKRQVAAIKRKMLKGRQQRQLAKEFGVTEQTITDIKKGRSWGHVMPEAKFGVGMPKGSKAGRAILTEKQVVKIKLRILTGETLADIARAYKVKFGVISSINGDRAWAQVRVPGWGRRSRDDRRFKNAKRT